MENYILISFLNDFIFCPRSIYFHQLYNNYETHLYHKKPQIDGKAAHSSIEKKKYSSRKNVLQGIEVYCEKYRLCGKIDLFDIDSGKLSERKREIKNIYDGYVFQVYAQYYALVEMGYKVNNIVLYDITHNKSYPIPRPFEVPEMLTKFENLINRINSFDLFANNFVPNKTKCVSCIYSNLCDYGLC